MSPEFSRPLRLDSLGGARSMRVEADEAERVALARRFGLVAIDALAAELEIRRVGEVVDVGGQLSAAVTQTCVATGEPVPALIDERFELRFLPSAMLASGVDEIELSERDCDMIGYEGDAIDLGEAVGETLALALHPFPRHPDADALLKAAGVLGEEDVGPFAALKALRDKLGKGG